MFPFESRWRWITATGYLHIVEAIREHIDTFEAPFDEILRDRAEKMEVGLRVRLVVLILLNLGLIATGVAWLVHVLPALGELESLVSTIAGTLTGVSLLFTGLFLVISRYLGQLQADMISSMALGTPGGPSLSAEERERFERIEAVAKERGWFPGGAGGGAKDS